MTETTVKYAIIIPVLVLNLIVPASSIFASPVNDPALEWHLLFVKIRDRLISKEEARSKLTALEILLKESYLKNAHVQGEDSLSFPLLGYDCHAIGGKGGSGYRAEGYDFFDGNDHRGHPAHDLFIRDRNQDGIDDGTGKPVEVVSISSGLVVSINLNWESASRIRGGNYIWIYEPIKSQYFYYAHLNEVLVRVGQTVSRWDRIGTVGRTGLNAYPKRSPTHLHLAVLQSAAGDPKPINPYLDLIKACQAGPPSR